MSLNIENTGCRPVPCFDDACVENGLADPGLCACGVFEIEVNRTPAALPIAARP